MKIFNYFKNSKTDIGDIQFSQQQLSYIVATLMLIFFFIFMAGYYWGKKSALENFSDILESDSLTDKINYAFCSNYDYNGECSSAEDKDDKEDKDESEDNKPEINNKIDKNIVANNIKNISSIESNIDNTANIGTKYLAELAGFGSLKSANNYEKELAKKGYEIKIITRKSKTSKGKEIKWYQAVSTQYCKKEELLEFIKNIKRIVPIKDVKIIVIDKNN